MKLAGIVCIVLACACAGYLASLRLREELHALELLCVWTEDAAACIRHQRTELGELLGYLSEHPNYRRFGFLREVCLQLSPMTPPDALWERAVCADRAVPATARESLIRLGKALGTTDCEGQLAVLALTRTQLTQAAADAREVCRTKGKLCRALGLLGGAMAAVMLI